MLQEIIRSNSIFCQEFLLETRNTRSFEVSCPTIVDIPFSFQVVSPYICLDAELRSETDLNNPLNLEVITKYRFSSFSLGNMVNIGNPIPMRLDTAGNWWSSLWASKKYDKRINAYLLMYNVILTDCTITRRDFSRKDKRKTHQEPHISKRLSSIKPISKPP